MYLPRHFTVTDLQHIAAFVDAAQAADLVTFDGTKPVATLLPVIWDRAAALAGATGQDREGDTGQEDGQGSQHDRQRGQHDGQRGQHDGQEGQRGGQGPQASAGSDDAVGREDGERRPDYGHLLGHIALANPQWQTVQPGATALAIVHGPQAYISPSWYEAKARHGRVVPTWNYEAVHLTGTLTIHRDPEWLRGLVTRLTRMHEEPRARPWAVTDAPPDYINGQLRAIVGVELAITSVEAKQKLGQNRSVLDQAGTVAGLRGEAGPGPAAIADLTAANLDAIAADHE